MREEGVVVGVQGRLVRVRMQPARECGSCCACAALGGEGRELEIESDLSVQVGSRVVVDIPQGNPWLSAVLVFVLPLAGLLSVLIVGGQFGAGDGTLLALGFGVLAALYALAALIDRAVVRKRVGPPTIVEALGPAT